MKRSLDTVNGVQQAKVFLVERELQPGGISLVNPLKIAKKTYIENMELAEGLQNAEAFVHANGLNKLKIIGRQMKNLHELMIDVLQETKFNHELHQVACNFVKKPGHTYHLYARPSGQKYFSMLSPHEWINAPHTFLGSWKLECDQSWTQVGDATTKYEGLQYLQQTYSLSGLKALTHSII